jgi:3-isopropylmalate dehydrogenase
MSSSYRHLMPAWSSALRRASSLKKELVEGLDILILRELTAASISSSQGHRDPADGTNARSTSRSTRRPRIRRNRVGGLRAREEAPHHVTRVEKSNVMHTGLPWREEVTKLHAEQ